MTDNEFPIPFKKMEGAGNDFIVLDNRKYDWSAEKIAELAPSMCQRKFGVGADGIMALTSNTDEKVDYTMIYRNADGSDAGMCGNGARCMALFAHTLGYDAKHSFNVHDQIYQAEVKNNSVAISFPMESSVNEPTVEGERIYQIHTGTEHIVLPVEEHQLKQEGELREKGSNLRYHRLFEPKGTNVNFISGEGEETVKLQTYERGVEDLTLACGTGAIASALVWHHLQDFEENDHTFKVKTEGGILSVKFTFDDDTSTYSNIKLEGPAHFVFKGEFLR